MSYRSTYLLTPEPEARFVIPQPVKDEHWIYYHLAADSSVLYIGRTSQPVQRTRAHEANAEWFEQVERLIWFGPMDEVNAKAAERELIQAEQPPNNVQHTDRATNWRDRPDARLKAARQKVDRLAAELFRAEGILRDLERAAADEDSQTG